jgi:hypothetical protein
MSDRSFEPAGADYVWHGVHTIIGLAILVVTSPVLVPLYVLGRASHRWMWAIEPPDPSEAEVWW